MFFFFKQKTAYEMRISDWSSDVCSSDLPSASRAAGFERSCMILGRKGVNRCTWRTGSRLTTGLVEGREGLPQKLFDALTLGGPHRCPQHRIGERLGVGPGCGDPGMEFGEQRTCERLLQPEIPGCPLGKRWYLK